MNDPRPAEHNESLWVLTVAPAIWALHFLMCYITAAIWCAKLAGRSAPLGDARLLIWTYTVFALAGIAGIGWRGLRQHRFGHAELPHDFDSAEDRHRFIGFATLLLAGLSAVSTVFVALAAVFIGDCR